MKLRRKGYGSGYQPRGKIPNRQGIHLWPPIVESRCRLGDLESVTILDTQASLALVTLTERKTLTTLGANVESRKADQVSAVSFAMLKPLK